MSSPIIVAWLLVSLPVLRPQSEVTPVNGKGEAFTKPFDAVMLDYLVKTKAPGGALSIFYKGKRVYSKGFGFANVEEKRAFTPTTPTRISSLSKHLTQRAITILIQGGKMSLESKAVDILAKGGIIPIVKQGNLVDSRLGKITVGQLLEHKSGIRAGLDISQCTSNEVIRLMGFNTPISPQEALGYVLGLPLESDPGTTINYSNFGYALLGKIVQIVSGKPYEEFVKTNVLSPKVDSSSWFVTSAQRKDKRREESDYYSSNSTPPWDAFRWDILAGAGGWVAPVEGLAEFFSKEFPGSGWDYTLFGSYTGAITVMKVHENSLTFAASINYRRGNSASDNEILFKNLEQVSSRLSLP